MSTYHVVIKKVEPQLVASIQDRIPDWDQVRPMLSRLFDEVYAYCGRNEAKFAGPALDLWHDSGRQKTDIRVETAAPLLQPIQASDRVQVYTLPGVETMASAIHHGSFDAIGEAHEAVVKWVEANGYRIDGPNREIYLQYAREGHPSDWITDIQYPVTKS